MKSTILIAILIVALLLPLVSAQIVVKSFIATPPQVLPGNEVAVELILENAGDDDVENIVVSLDLTQMPFAPVGSSTEKGLDELRDHRKEKILFMLKALPSAEPSIYKIPVVMTYNGTSRTAFISLEVISVARLDVLLGDAEILTVNHQGKITLKFVNNGLSAVHFLKVTLPGSPLYTFISPNAVYIGDVDVGDFETEEFAIIPKIDDPVMTIYLEYRDNTNRQIVESKLLQLPVYTEEEVNRLGLGEPKSMILPIVAAIVALGGLFIIYKKVRKRRKHES